MLTTNKDMTYSYYSWPLGTNDATAVDETYKLSGTDERADLEIQMRAISELHDKYRSWFNEEDKLRLDRMERLRREATVWDIQWMRDELEYFESVLRSNSYSIRIYDDSTYMNRIDEENPGTTTPLFYDSEPKTSESSDTSCIVL